MDKKQAQEIVKNTFEYPFDKERFISFVKNLLNSIEEAPFSYKGNFIPDAYDQSVSTLERIGKYTDGEHKIDILVVKLRKETSIERARTMQRNFIAWYLNGSRGGEMKDAALAAFVSPNAEDWRFSLVKMDYRFEEGKNGRVKVKEEFTPARRWSFLVGGNENSHTAQSRLVSIIADDEHNPTLAQLEEAFNIEKVAKEFFEKYRELFLRTKETLDEVSSRNKIIKADFEAKGVNTVDFTKKLLGQIVFLYFLQKKGWFGVQRDAAWSTGSKHFLRELFDGIHGKYKNFFNDILEPLFYDALARDRSDIDHWNDQFKCKIPFLNGGLFDPINNYDWVHTDILLPNELFSNTLKTKEGDTGNGILDIFDRYNFTVKEDEPLEKEVAIDPEMLGKVFENLLEVRDRKSKGTYYTPREIVHFMCQQSLINYLATELEEKVNKEDIDTLIKYGEQVGENEATVETKGRETRTYFYKLPENIRQNAKLVDDKLTDIKLCDPAVGSGAFPVGMMGEIVKTRNVLSAFIKGPDRTIYNFKRECIEKSLYGVDIDPGAVEIAKLRLWLSLVVDEEDIKQIKPLPNLDYKIVCGNSLLGVEKNLFNNTLFKELERIKPLLFNETSPKKKQEYKNQIGDTISLITTGHTEFDFEVYFSEIFHEKKGFDVVIANPPYVRADSKVDPFVKTII
jgi:type I restriction-modification system DNA methylase subunit